MAQVPTYYVMERDKGMAETVAPMMPAPAWVQQEQPERVRHLLIEFLREHAA